MWLSFDAETPEVQTGNEPRNLEVLEFGRRFPLVVGGVNSECRCNRYQYKYFCPYVVYS